MSTFTYVIESFQSGIWVALTDPEPVTDPGTAEEYARHIASRYDSNQVRVRVWHGTPDTITGRHADAVWPPHYAPTAPRPNL